MATADMKITYIAHSGFCIELDRTVMLFDYFTGEIPSWSADKRILVFASHKHKDHFNPVIFELATVYKNIHYFFGSDIRLNEKWLVGKKINPAVMNLVSTMKGHESAVFEDVKIQTLTSTDEGVAFMAEAQGYSFYHAGDLNWWFWKEEEAGWNRNMEVNYKQEIDSIAGRHFDAAFVPLDPRLQEGYGYGMDYFLDNTDSSRIFPMHMWEKYDYISQYCLTPTGERHADRIVQMGTRGDVFCFSGGSSE